MWATLRHSPVSNATEAWKGTGLSCAARPAYPSTAQLVTIRLAAPQPRGGEPGIIEGPQGARSNGEKTRLLNSASLCRNRPVIRALAVG
jgi:hypothetical protein